MPADDALVRVLAGTVVWVAFTVAEGAGTSGVDTLVIGVCCVVVTGVPGVDSGTVVWFCISGVRKSSDRRALEMSPLGLSLAIFYMKVSIRSLVVNIDTYAWLL